MAGMGHNKVSVCTMLKEKLEYAYVANSNIQSRWCSGRYGRALLRCSKSQLGLGERLRQQL